MDLPKTVADLTPHPDNPREISDAALVGLHFSMDRFGSIAGIVWNTRTGHVAAGHQRLKKFDADAPIVNYREVKDDKGTVGYGEIHADGTVWDVRFVDWDAATERAALIAANSNTIAGEWTEAVIPILEDLKFEIPELAGPLMFEELRIDLDAHFEELTKDGSQTVTSPGSFGEVDPTKQTDHRCPKCGYEWNGTAT